MWSGSGITSVSVLKPTRTVPAYVKMQVPSVWSPDPGTQPSRLVIRVPAR